MTDQEFDKYLKTCYEELQEKQDQLKINYNIGIFEGYYYDQIRKVLQFKNNDIVELEFSVIFIGTWAKNKNDWLWAWANESMAESVREDSSMLKNIFKTTGFEIFKSPNMVADELQSWELTALSLKELNAIGAYKVPSEKSDLFIAIIEVVK